MLTSDLLSLLIYDLRSMATSVSLPEANLSTSLSNSHGLESLLLPQGAPWIFKN